LSRWTRFLPIFQLEKYKFIMPTLSQEILTVELVFALKLKKRPKDVLPHKKLLREVSTYLVYI